MPGRIKELIITARYENIPYLLIEEQVRREIPIISNCILVGDNKRFLSLLITIKCHIDANGNPTDLIDGHILPILKELGSSSLFVNNAIQDQVIIEYIDSCIHKINQRSRSNAQRIQKFAILPVDFSVAGEELGPTMKIKRGFILNKYKDVIDKLYK